MFLFYCSDLNIDLGSVQRSNLVCVCVCIKQLTSPIDL